MNQKNNNSTWQMSPELEKILGPIEKDIKAGRNMSKLISFPEELDEVLGTRSQFIMNN